jgi:hypothetical protein
VEELRSSVRQHDESKETFHCQDVILAQNTGQEQDNQVNRSSMKSASAQSILALVEGFKHCDQ